MRNVYKLEFVRVFEEKNAYVWLKFQGWYQEFTNWY